MLPASHDRWHDRVEGTALIDPALTAVVPAHDTSAEVTRAIPLVAPVPRAPSPVRRFAPWIAFGVVAAAVVAGTTAWSATLRGPDEPLLARTAMPSLARSAPLDAGVPTVLPDEPPPTSAALGDVPVVPGPPASTGRSAAAAPAPRSIAPPPADERPVPRRPVAPQPPPPDEEDPAEPTTEPRPSASKAPDDDEGCDPPRSLQCEGSMPTAPGPTRP